MNKIYLDFEFNRTNEPLVNLISCAFSNQGKEHSIWLEGIKSNEDKLRDYFWKRRKDHIFVGYAITAEARAFQSLGLDPREFIWNDLYCEWRQLTFNNYDCQYGWYVKEGTNIWKRSVPPDYKNPNKNIGKDNKEIGVSLTSAVAALLRINLDSRHKTEMRNLIIGGGPFDAEEKKQILEYGLSDIKYLPQIDNIMEEKLLAALRRLRVTRQQIQEHRIERARFAVDVSYMERTGTPIDVKALHNLIRNKDKVTKKLIRLVNEKYPFFIYKKTSDFKYKGTWTDSYSQFEKFVKDHPLLNYDKWERTEKGALKKEDKYLSKYDGIDELKLYRQTKKTLGQLKWFKQNKDGTSDFLSTIGSDNRSRTFFGIFGSQTSRNQPKASQFIFAMSSWLRCLIRPPKGYVLTEIDFASQEFAIAAALSCDPVMLEAYRSGDPYLYFGKYVGGIPKDGTKETHKELRELFKAVILGLQYGLSVAGLALHLTNTLKRLVTEAEADKLYNYHRTAFRVFWKWQDGIYQKYLRDGAMQICHDWFLLGDNPNSLSIKNAPTQGLGGSMIRKSLHHCLNNNIEVVATLHDAIYILSKEENVEADIKLAEECMDRAVRDCLKDKYIKIRTEASSHRWDEVWISGKGKKFYEELKDYLEPMKNVAEREQELIDMFYTLPEGIPY